MTGHFSKRSFLIELGDGDPDFGLCAKSRTNARGNKPQTDLVVSPGTNTTKFLDPTLLDSLYHPPSKIPAKGAVHIPLMSFKIQDSAGADVNHFETWSRPRPGGLTFSLRGSGGGPSSLALAACGLRYFFSNVKLCLYGVLIRVIRF
jgi:hypothetical protein